MERKYTDAERKAHQTYYQKNRATILKKNRDRTFTPHGKAVKMWNSLHKRAGNKDGKNPTYKDIKILVTREEFLGWAVPVLEDWIKTKTIETASLDRIEDTDHYILGRMQIISKSQNTRKCSKNKNVHAPEGMAWCSQCKFYLKRDEFTKSTKQHHGLNYLCKYHSRLRNNINRSKLKNNP